MIITLPIYLTSNHRHDNILTGTDWTGEYEKNALKTIATVSEFASLASYTIPDVPSGWRPSWLNRLVGGSTTSKHLFAQAIDVSDPERKFGTWLVSNIALLRSRNCAIESLSVTHASDDPAGRWVHFQILLPLSGNVVFTP